MKKSVSSTNKKSGFFRLVGLAAFILCAAVFINALPNTRAQAESNGSSSGLAEVFNWQSNDFSAQILASVEQATKSVQKAAADLDSPNAPTATVTTNGGSGLAGTYPDLASAITALNAATITSPVVISVSGNETAPVGGYSITQLGGTSTNTITIQGSSSTLTAPAAPPVGQRYDAVIRIIGGDYITIQGFTITENSANTVGGAVGVQQMTEFGVALFAATTTNGAQNNTIQNNIITMSSTTAYQNAIGIFSSSASSSTNGTLAAASIAGTNSNNKFYGNTISGVAQGFYFISPTQTATVFESGNDIGGTTLGQGNNITFGISNTAGDLGFTSYSGATAAGIYFRNVVGNSARFNTINSTATLTLPEGGIFSASGTAPSGITYTSTFSNNTITLTNTGTSAMTGIDFGSGLSTGTIAGSNNTVTLNQTASAANSATLIGIKANYASATNTLNTNTITVNQSQSAASTTSAVTGITGAGVGTTVTASSNNVTIKQAQSGAGSYGSGAITYIDVSAASGTIISSGNTLNTTGSTIRSTGSLICINQNSTSTVSDTFNNNIVNIDRVAASGTVFFTSSTNTPSMPSVTATGNNIAFTNLAGSTSVTAISVLGGPTGGGTKNVSNNTISITGTNTGTSKGIAWGYTIGTGGGTFSGNSITINNAATALVGLDGINTSAGNATLNNNTLSLTSSTTSPTSMVGINGAATGPYQITNTTFNALNFTGIITGSPTVSGIAVSVGTGNNISSNVITNISVGASGSTANSIVDGILVSGGTSTNVFKNKIYGLTSASTGTTGVVNGIRLSGGTTNTVYNNLIGNLTTPASANPDSIRGISITSTTTSSTNNVYYNTVYLNASSTGANFGTTGIFHAASSTATTATLNLRNNIIANNSTPAGTGLVVAFRRSSGAASTLANYASTSNNNDFYAGTPGASNLIYSDGTSSAQTIAAYKSGVFTAGTIAPRDSASISELPPFLSTAGSNANFLHIDPSVATNLESGGAPISGFTDDYDGETRNASFPDIGADEFTGTPGGDAIAPVINYSALANTASTGSRTLSVTVTDNIGVTQVYVYYKVNAGSYSSAACTMTGGTATNGTYDCVIAASVVAGDTVSYFVAASDAANNVGTNPAGGTGTNASNVTTPPASPNTYTIIGTISGTKTVGTGGTYATLTAAAAALNGNELSGPVTLSLTDATYTEAATVNFNANNGSSSTNTVTIKPATGVTSTINVSSAGCAISFNGADYMTIDGSNAVGGTSRDLTINNTNTGTSSAVVCLTTAASPGLGATNDVVKNTNIAGNAGTTTLFGIFSGSSTISTGSTGTNNDNNTFQNNNVSKVQYGIFSQGASGAVKNTGNTITQNLLNSTSSNAIGRTGILVGFENNISISQNTIDNIASATSSQDEFGISLGILSITTGTFTGNEVTNATVNRNYIGTVKQTATYSACGICVAPVTTVGAQTNTIRNNMVAGVFADGTSSDFSAGIFIGGGAGTTNIYFNSVSMSTPSGAPTDGSDKSMALAIGGSNPIVDIRNNILSNTQNVGTTVNYDIVFGYSTFTNLTSDYNDFFNPVNATHNVGGTGSIASPTAQTTLANLQTATGKDANSKNVDPLFTSATDLHISGASTLIGMGQAIAGVTVDFDGETRDTPPEIGADEIPTIIAPGVLQFSSATYSNSEGATQTITVTRTMGTTGAVTVDYALSSSTGAVFGTSCGAGADYAAPSATGTLNFADGQASATFMVQLCTDTDSPETGENVTLTLSNPQNTTDPMMPPSIGANNPATLTIINVAPPITGGSINVGAGQSYTSLTNTGGVFDMINAAAVTSNITVNITSDLTAETGTVALNDADGFSVTITPSGAARIVSGAAATNALIRLNGASNVTIDGSTSGGTDRSLTIENTGATTPTVVRFGSIGTNPITNDTLKNTIVRNGVNTSSAVTVLDTAGSLGGYFNNITIQNNSVQKAFRGILASAIVSGTNGSGLNITGNSLNTTGANSIRLNPILVAGANGVSITNNTLGGISDANAEVPQGIILSTGTDNAVVSGNTISGIASTNTTSSGSASGIVISAGATATSISVSNNTISTLSSAGTAANFYAIGSFSPNVTISGNTISGMTESNTGTAGAFGIVLVGVNNNTVSGNSVSAITIAGTSVASGIQSQGASTNVVIERNRVFNIKSTESTGYGANGIQLSSTSTTANHIVRNNFVYDVAGVGFNGSGVADNGYGIIVTSGAGYGIYNNSVLMNTNQTATTGLPAAFNVTSGVTTAGAINLRNNIFANTQTVGTQRYSIYSGAANTVFAAIDYNDYFTTGPNLGFIGSNRATLADIVTGFGGNANSKSVNPAFVSATDLHLQATSPLFGMGVSIASVTNDFDGETRPSNPDIGADEVLNGTLALSSATYSVNETAGTVTITVNRTGGSVGAISVPYTLTDGSATGGTCGAGNDFDNTGGTVNFADGVTTAQTFTVAICDDAVYEGDETFNVVLGTGTGGAAVGTPASAVVTITDNEAIPTISINSVSVSEGGGNAVFTVTQSGLSAFTTTFTYSTADGSATTADNDYTAVSTGGSITAGGLTTTVSVPITSDTTTEPDETFTVTLSAPVNATVTGGAGTGTILNDETGSTTIPAGTYTNLNTGPGATLSGDVTVTGTLTLGGTLSTNGNTLTFDCNGMVSGAGPLPGDPNYVDGNVKKNFCGSTDAFSFPVGDNGYSPVTVTPSSAPSAGTNLTVDANDSLLSGLSSLNSASRSWQLDLNPGGSLSATLAFTYTDADITGDESTYKIYKNPGLTLISPSTPNPGANTVTTDAPQTSFSPWGVGNAPTAAAVDVTGRVREANGRGIFRARVTMTDTAGNVRMAMTNTMGFFRFADVPSGANYVFSAFHRRYQFAQGSQVRFIAGDNETVNFTASGLNEGLNPNARYFDNAPFDFDGDGRTDVSVYRESNNTWYITRSSDNTLFTQAFGAAGDRLVPADYDGDGRTDLAVFRPSTGSWYIWESTSNSIRVEQFGADASRAIPADFDGDGKADLSAWTEISRTWQVKSSVDGTVSTERFAAFGKGNFAPIASDRTGDGRADMIFFNQTNGTWRVRASESGKVAEEHFGQAGDRAVIGDYDGDGIGDLAVYRAGQNAWLVRTNDGREMTIGGLGAGNRTIVGDFDGDGRADTAGFENGLWSIRQSVNQFVRQQQFGLASDAVIPSAF